MNEAVRLAIEKGGYIDPLTKVGIKHFPTEHFDPMHPQIAQDPLFWQALGKACVNEWGEVTFFGTEGQTKPTWLLKAHQYFDLVLTGGDTEQFFKELLKNQSNGNSKTT